MEGLKLNWYYYTNNPNVLFKMHILKSEHHTRKMNNKPLGSRPKM